MVLWSLCWVGLVGAISFWFATFSAAETSNVEITGARRARRAANPGVFLRTVPMNGPFSSEAVSLRNMLIFLTAVLALRGFVGF